MQAPLLRYRSGAVPGRRRPIGQGELELAPDAFVIGHVGRFVEEKNHVFCSKSFDTSWAPIPKLAWY